MGQELHPHWQIAIEDTSPMNLCVRRDAHVFMCVAAPAPSARVSRRPLVAPLAYPAQRPCAGGSGWRVAAYVAPVRAANVSGGPTVGDGAGEAHVAVSWPPLTRENGRAAAQRGAGRGAGSRSQGRCARG